MNLEGLAKDPMTGAVREHFKAQGYNQGDFDRLFESLGVLQEKGMLAAPLDFGAETARLGDNGRGRQQEVETFAKSLKERGDITDGEFTQLISLAPMADGVTLVEKLRKMVGSQDGKLDPPDAGNGQKDGETVEQKEARELSKDPRYGREGAFTKDADAKWKKAFGG